MTARSQRKHRSSVGGDLDVVTSNHRAVLGDAPAELAKAAERPDRHPVYWRTFAGGWGMCSPRLLSAHLRCIIDTVERHVA